MRATIVSVLALFFAALLVNGCGNKKPKSKHAKDLDGGVADAGDEEVIDEEEVGEDSTVDTGISDDGSGAGEPEPVPEPEPVDVVAEARERASVAGLLPFAEELASLRDSELTDTLETNDLAGPVDEELPGNER